MSRVRTYEIPAKFMLTTTADLREIGYLIIKSELDINSLTEVRTLMPTGKILKGVVRVHFDIPKELEENDPAEACGREPVECSGTSADSSDS